MAQRSTLGRDMGIGALVLAGAVVLYVQVPKWRDARTKRDALQSYAREWGRYLQCVAGTPVRPGEKPSTRVARVLINLGPAPGDWPDRCGPHVVAMKSALDDSMCEKEAPTEGLCSLTRSLSALSNDPGSLREIDAIADQLAQLHVDVPDAGQEPGPPAAPATPLEHLAPLPVAMPSAADVVDDPIPGEALRLYGTGISPWCCAFHASRNALPLEHAHCESVVESGDATMLFPFSSADAATRSVVFAKGFGISSDWSGPLVLAKGVAEPLFRGAAGHGFVLADGTALSVLVPEAGPAKLAVLRPDATAVTVRLPAGADVQTPDPEDLAQHPTLYAAQLLDESPVVLGDELVYAAGAEGKKRLLARGLSPDGSLAPEVELSPAGPAHYREFRACRSAGLLALAAEDVRRPPSIAIHLRVDGRWITPSDATVAVPTNAYWPGGVVLGCRGREATLTWIVAGERGHVAPSFRVAQLRCAADGCTRSDSGDIQRLSLDFRRPVVGDLQGKVLLVRVVDVPTPAFGGFVESLRFRLAPVASLAASADVTLLGHVQADSPVSVATEELREVRLFVRPDAAVVLAGRTPIRIDPAGHAGPVEIEPAP